MSNLYYQTISELEQKNVAKDYIIGWASGFLGNPKIEEQRMTKSWESGYEDGRGKHTDGAEKWAV